MKDDGNNRTRDIMAVLSAFLLLIGAKRLSEWWKDAKLNFAWPFVLAFVLAMLFAAAAFVYSFLETE